MGCLKLNIENPASLRVFNGGKSTVSKNDVKAYRYGYQGSEKDDEIKGQGNSYTTQFRQLDPRVGRWLSIDPLADKYPGMSPYTSMNNNPITTNDQLGLEGTDWVKGKASNSWKWHSDVSSESEAREKLGDDFGGYAAPYEEVYKSHMGNIELGDKGKWEVTDRETSNSELNVFGMPIDNSYAMSQLKYAERHQKLVANSKALEDFILYYAGASATAPFLIAYGVITAPAWAPPVVGAAKAYHYTFGVNGGYQNMLVDGTLQSATNSDFNYYSFIGSGFIPGNNFNTIVGFEVSSSFINIKNSGVVLDVPNANGVFEKSTTLMWNLYGSSKYGFPLLGNYWDYATKKSTSTVQDNK